jgi:hypothetical protein
MSKDTSLIEIKNQIQNFRRLADLFETRFAEIEAFFEGKDILPERLLKERFPLPLILGELSPNPESEEEGLLHPAEIVKITACKIVQLTTAVSASKRDQPEYSLYKELLGKKLAYLKDTISDIIGKIDEDKPVWKRSTS